MLAVLIIASALWFGGGVLGIPRGLRAGLIAVMYVALVSLHLVFPADHPLRLSTDGSAAPWLLLGGFAVLVVLYRQGLNTLRPVPIRNLRPQPRIVFPTVNSTAMRVISYCVRLAAPGRRH